MTHLNIIFGKDVHLKFKLRDTSITNRWAEKLIKAQTLGYTIDDPTRFYWFNTFDEEAERSIRQMNDCISKINSYAPIIERKLTSIEDQDTLNYLHHIFEEYHGLLDTQKQNDFFKDAPDEIKTELATLNLHVHRCEGVGRGIKPRVVVTYYGLPKEDKYDVIDYLHFTNDYSFGTVYINYAEIGKTLEDLAKDDDKYIAEAAFMPLRHYSADFTIKFFDAGAEAQRELDLVSNYYDRHAKWFSKRGYRKDSPELVTGRCPVADLVTDKTQVEILNTLKDNQIVTRVWLE